MYTVIKMICILYSLKQMLTLKTYTHLYAIHNS